MSSIRRAVILVSSAALVFAGGILAGRLRAQQPALTAPANPSPYYVVDFVDIAPGNANESVALIKQYIIDAHKEPGIQRVEALSQISRTNHFVIYEVWQNEDAFHKHEAAASTRQFRDKIGPMLGAPYDQRAHFKIE
jgi:quinol monooxygenase YgiN